jgi:transmembrane sensor
MTTVNRYANYTAIQLATDTSFISWIKWPTEANNLFWKEYLQKYPSQSGAVDNAKIIVSEMRIGSEKMDESRANEIWNKISKQLNQLPADKELQPVTYMHRRNWWAAAAVLLLVSLTGYLFTRQGTKNEIAKNNEREPTHQHDKAPGGNKAILTLADGSTVILDTTTNGAITKQGSITIIKLDGQLTYTKKGSASKEILYNTITTPKGGQYQIVLPDGTKVWLNAASGLHFPTEFRGKERNVELTGEAYFEVAKNAAMPFHVLVNNMKVEVLGTHFNVMAYDDEAAVKTTLLEGSVKVTEGNQAILLLPFQQALLQRSGNILSSRDADVEKEVAWKNGKFVFEDDDVSSIMKQLSRWYDIEVEFKGDINAHYSGKVTRQANISKVLKMLESAGGVSFEINNNKVTVLAR